MMLARREMVQQTERKLRDHSSKNERAGIDASAQLLQLESYCRVCVPACTPTEYLQIWILTKAAETRNKNKNDLSIAVCGSSTAGDFTVLCHRIASEVTGQRPSCHWQRKTTSPKKSNLPGRWMLSHGRTRRMVGTKTDWVIGGTKNVGINEKTTYNCCVTGHPLTSKP